MVISPGIPTDRDPDLDKDISLLIDEVVPGLVPDVEAWKTTPNPQFGFKAPVDLIGTPMEGFLRDTLRAAKQGAFS